MQQLIASYLFQYKTCPLPGLGTLRIVHKSAAANFPDKTIHAPEPEIVFDHTETDAGTLVDYIAARTNCPVLSAIDSLGKYCNLLKSELNANAIAAINMVGSFSGDAGGEIQFKPAQLPAVLLPAVVAERVVHPEAAHTMLVGDKETTNTQMAEYYAESSVPKNYWWVWAIILGAVALLALLLYYNDAFASSSFGNISPAL